MWNINVSREVTFQIDTVCMSIVSNFSQGVCTLQMHRESRDRYNEIRHAYLSYSKWRKSKNLQLNCFHKEHDFHLRFLIDWVKLEFVVIYRLFCVLKDYYIDIKVWENKLDYKTQEVCQEYIYVERVTKEMSIVCRFLDDRAW